MKNILLMLWLLLSMGAFLTAEAGVYKCTGPNGNIIYSDTPCSHDAEKMPDWLLEKNVLQKTPNISETKPAPIQEPRNGSYNSEYYPQNEELSVKKCKLIELINYTPFEEQRVSGGVVTGQVLPGGVVAGGTLYNGKIKVKRCAEIYFKWIDYRSLLNRKDFGKEIAQTLEAVFENGSVVMGKTGSLYGQVGRVKQGESYTGKICFGDSNHSISRIQCR